MGKQWLTLFWGAPKSLQMVTAAMKLKDSCFLEENLDNILKQPIQHIKNNLDNILKQPRQHIKKQSHYFANKGPSSQSYGFSSGHVWM